ncbi:hypothetical protein [Chitinimonas sp.]|uniref:hypothetical protein n=1 Tax=Chitinimonas sp. TaxID=1934313 RepID=UPI002F92FB2F
MKKRCHLIEIQPEKLPQQALDELQALAFEHNHGETLTDRHIGVLACTGTPVELALSIAEWTNYVTLFCHTLNLSETDLQALAAQEIRLEKRPVDRLLGEPGRLEGVLLEDGDVVVVDALFARAGGEAG